MIEYENLPKYEFEFYEEMIMPRAEIKRLNQAINFEESVK